MASACQQVMRQLPNGMLHVGANIGRSYGILVPCVGTLRLWLRGR